MAAAAAVLLAILVYAVAAPTWAAKEVAVVRLVPAPAQQVLAVVGRVRSQNVVDVRAENPGALVDLLRDEGDVVVAGELLARVRSRQQAAAAAASRAQLRALEAQVELAQVQYRRAETLARQGWVTRAALDEARTALRAAIADRDAAQASLTAAQELVREFEVRAPMAGMILARPVDPGQVVDATDTIFQIGSDGPIEVVAEVDEIYADVVRVGMPALLSASGSAEQVPGHVFEVAPRVDPLTGGRIVRVRLDRPDPNFRPGRSIDVSVEIARFDRVLSVPRSALQRAGDGWRVLLIADGRVVARPVTILDWPGRSVIVRSGLSAGDLAVLDPTSVTPGTRAEAVEAAAGEAAPRGG